MFMGLIKTMENKLSFIDLVHLAHLFVSGGFLILIFLTFDNFLICIVFERVKSAVIDGFVGLIGSSLAVFRLLSRVRSAISFLVLKNEMNFNGVLP